MNAKNRRNTSHCRDSNIRWDTNTIGNTRSRRNVYNSRTPATTEKDANNVKTPESEQTSTTAGLQQHHNADNSMSAKHRRDVSHIRYFINSRNNKISRVTPGRERMPTTAGSQKQQKCQQQNDSAGKISQSRETGNFWNCRCR
jgi:hypothetical protein